MRTIKTYFKRAPFYNALIRTWPYSSLQANRSARMQSMKKGIFTAIVLTAILGAIAVPFTWIRAWRTELTLDGHPVNDARVYRNWSGDVLVDLRPVFGYLYVVRKSDTTVGIPNGSFLMESPAFVLTREHPLRVVDIRSAKAGGINPNLTMSSRSLSFRATDGRTINLISY